MMLHINGNVKYVQLDGNGDDDEVSEDDDEASNCQSYERLSHDACELIFTQSDAHSTTLSTSSSKAIPDTWMLLDSQSTVDVFCNGKLLERIHKINTNMTI